MYSCLDDRRRCRDAYRHRRRCCVIIAVITVVFMSCPTATSCGLAEYGTVCLWHGTWHGARHP